MKNIQKTVYMEICKTLRKKINEIETYREKVVESRIQITKSYTKAKRIMNEREHGHSKRSGLKDIVAELIK